MGRLVHKLQGGAAVLAFGLCLSGAISAQQAGPPPDPATPSTIAGHMTKVKKIAGDNAYLQYYATPGQGYWCDAPAAGVTMRNVSKDPAAPLQLFDNVWMFGTGYVDTMVLKTSAGLIVWDTLDNEQEEKTIFEPGMKAAGLDPKDIKMVILTHGHGDHYGGAKYLQDTYHVPVALSDADWDLIAGTKPRPGSDPLPPPAKDKVLTDGQKITVGDTNVTIVLTPGHTPATVSSIFPVKDHGKTITVAMWGGTAYPATRAGLDMMGDSMDKFAKATKAAHAVAVLNTHAFLSNIPPLLAGMTPGGKNPLVVGSATVQKQIAIMHECQRAMGDWYTAMGKGPGA